jgi:hypothetical protein
LGKVNRAGERLSCYSSDDISAKIELPSWRQYKSGNFVAVPPLNSDEIIGKDDDDDSWADPGVPSGGWSRPGDGNDKDDSESEEDTQGGENGTMKGTGKGKGTKDGKGNGKGTGKGKGMVKVKGTVL